jgi:ribose transport system substrate-binding protein
MIKHVKPLAACFLAALLVGCAASPAPTPTTARYRVTLIAKSTGTEFWGAVFAGAEAAATEYNMDLTITGPESEEDYTAQNDLIEKAVEDGTQAIIFSASDYQQNAAAIDAAADKGVRIVVVDSTVNSNKISAYVGADNYGAGQMAAESALENVEGPLHVGLVSYNVNSPNAQQREDGVIDTFAASGRAEVSATVYSVATPESARAETLTMLTRHPEINVLISFNEAVSVGAAQAVSDLGRADDLWMVAFDSNIATVDALHTGAVDAMVVQNTYGMGYYSVENAYKLLAGQGSDVTNEIETATRIIDRSNIFALNGQKAVFPFE